MKFIKVYCEGIKFVIKLVEADAIIIKINAKLVSSKLFNFPIIAFFGSLRFFHYKISSWSSSDIFVKCFDFSFVKIKILNGIETRYTRQKINSVSKV